jgi:hypothetical protein
MRKSSKGSAQLLVYIQARDVMDRLDDVFGTGMWSDSYSTVLLRDDGKDERGVNQFVCAVECKLGVNAHPDWMTGSMHVSDVGTGDGADAVKGAYSDALKRAAVKLGVGRYLYGLKLETWYPLDERGYDLSAAGHKQAMADIARKLSAKPAAPAPDADVEYAPPVQVQTVRGAPPKPPLTRQVPDGETADMWDTPSQGGEPMGFSDEAVSLLSKWQEMAEAEDAVASDAQVKLLAGLVDGATRPGAYTAVVSALIGDGIPLGKRLAKDLLDGLLKRTKDKTGEWGDNPAYQPAYAKALAEIYATVGD